MKVLFSSYRPDQYADPESFCVQVGMIFEDFAADVLARATHPRTGIQSTLTFPPSIHELIEFLKTTEKVLEGEAIIAERKAQGFEWIDEPAENMVGFYNAEGIEWHKRDIPRLAGPAKPLSITQQGQAERAIATAAQRMDGPRFEVPLTPDDGRYAERIAADLAARKARNEQLAAEMEQKVQPGNDLELVPAPSSRPYESRSETATSPHFRCRRQCRQLQARTPRVVRWKLFIPAARIRHHHSRRIRNNQSDRTARLAPGWFEQGRHNGNISTTQGRRVMEALVTVLPPIGMEELYFRFQFLRGPRYYL
jgi:hypothetical protein